MTAIPRYEAFKAQASKARSYIADKSKRAFAVVKPSYATIWTWVWVPCAFGVMYFGMKVLGKPVSKGVGSYDDLTDYLMEIGSRSFPLLVAIAITYLVAGRLGWNLDNKKRNDMQFALSSPLLIDPKHPWASTFGGIFQRVGLFTVLAGEMASILALLWLFLRALIVWQG